MPEGVLVTEARGPKATGSIPWADHAGIVVSGVPEETVEVKRISRAIAEEAARAGDLRELRRACASRRPMGTKPTSSPMTPKGPVRLPK